MTEVTATPNLIIRGSLFLGAAALLFPVKDAFVKSVGEAVSPLEAAAVYLAVQAIVTVSWLSIASSCSRLSDIGIRFWPLLARSSFMILAIVLFFASIQVASLAEAVTLFTTNALFVVIFGGLVLRERVKVKTVAAVLLGFCGVLLVMRPTLSNLPDPYLLLALASAICYAGFITTTRRIAEFVEPAEMLFFDGVIGASLCMVAAIALTKISAFEISIDTIIAGDAIRLIASGVIGTMSALFVILAMKAAPASRIAVWGYLEIPSAVIIGIVAFDEYPSSLSLIGATIILLSCYLSAKQPTTSAVSEESDADD